MGNIVLKGVHKTGTLLEGFQGGRPVGSGFEFFNYGIQFFNGLLDVRHAEGPFFKRWNFFVGHVFLLIVNESAGIEAPHDEAVGIGDGP